MTITLKQIFDKIGYEEVKDNLGTSEYILDFGKIIIHKKKFPNGVDKITLMETTENCRTDENTFLKVGIVKFSREYDPFCEFDFWSIVLTFEFCIEVFGRNNWYYQQIEILELRNLGKSIEEVLKYISENTILDLS